MGCYGCYNNSGSSGQRSHSCRDGIHACCRRGGEMLLLCNSKAEVSDLVDYSWSAAAERLPYNGRRYIQGQCPFGAKKVDNRPTERQDHLIYFYMSEAEDKASSRRQPERIANCPCPPERPATGDRVRQESPLAVWRLYRPQSRRLAPSSRCIWPSGHEGRQELTHDLVSGRRPGILLSMEWFADEQQT